MIILPTTALSKYVKTNIRSPWQGGGLWPNPDRDKVYWAICCDISSCGKKIIEWKDNCEDVDDMEIMRCDELEIEDERGVTRVITPAGRSRVFPDVYHLRNDSRQLCKDCYNDYKDEEVTWYKSSY